MSARSRSAPPGCECVVPPEACALHATAPDLLAALKGLLGVGRALAPGRREIDAARAAIAKAEGRP